MFNNFQDCIQDTYETFSFSFQNLKILIFSEYGKGDEINSKVTETKDHDFLFLGVPSLHKDLEESNEDLFGKNENDDGRVSTMGYENSLTERDLNPTRKTKNQIEYLVDEDSYNSSKFQSDTVRLCSIYFSLY